MSEGCTCTYTYIHTSFPSDIIERLPVVASKTVSSKWNVWTFTLPYRRPLASYRTGYRVIGWGRGGGTTCDSKAASAAANPISITQWYRRLKMVKLKIGSVRLHVVINNNLRFVYLCTCTHGNVPVNFNLLHSLSLFKVRAPPVTQQPFSPRCSKGEGKRNIGVSR